MDLASLNEQVQPDRRYEAIVLVQEAAARWPEPLGAIAAACATGMVLGLAGSSAHDLAADLPDGFDPGPGALLMASSASPGRVIVDRSGVWVGQRDTGPEGADDPLKWMYDELWARGVGPNNVLVVGGSEAPAVLARQLDQRRRRILPSVRPEPGWEMTSEGFDINRLRVNAALFALADGVVGTSGTPLAAHPESRRWVLVGNAYVGTGPETHLLTAPVAMQLPIEMADMPDVRRRLDLRSGVLHEEVSTSAGPLTSVRFSSLARPGTVVFRAQCPAPCPDGPPLLAPADDPTADEGIEGTARWMRTAGEPGGIVAAATDMRCGEVVDRFAVYRADPERMPEPGEALARLSDAAAAGVDALLVEHRQAWAERWADADVVIEGDDELQRAVRFSLFHLMASVPDLGEAAVGARGLSGTSYRGHVFWDADTFTLPFLAATHPASARAMLEYRLRRLPAAMALATELSQ